MSLPESIAAAVRAGGDSLGIIVQRLTAMGDIVRTVPAVRLIRRALPRARIHWVVEDRWSPVIEGHRDLDGIVKLPRRRWGRLLRGPTSWPTLLREVAGFRKELRDLGAGLLLDFHGNLRSGLTASISGAPVRVGYAGHQQKEGNHRFMTHHVPSGDRRTPRMERNLDLVRWLGLPVAPLPDGALPLVRAGSETARRICAELAGGGDYAVINPGASGAQAYKKPPIPLLVAAARRLAEAGLAPIVAWGPGEQDDARAVVDGAGAAAVLAPATDLAELSALLDLARLFVGGDSGPMHVACAVGCPVVAVYGPTDPRVNQPWGVPCRTVSPPGRTYTGIKRIDRGGGFDGISPQAVVDAIDAVMDVPRLRGPSPASPRGEAR